MALVLGVCPRSFKDEKSGDTIKGFAVRVATDWNSDDGIGYDTDKLFIRSDSPNAMERIVQYKQFCNSGTNVRVHYNRYGKIEDLEEI